MLLLVHKGPLAGLAKELLLLWIFQGDFPKVPGKFPRCPPEVPQTSSPKVTDLPRGQSLSFSLFGKPDAL